MTSFEEKLRLQLGVTRANGTDPPESDLEHYRRTENYTGADLSTLQSVVYARQREADRERQEAAGRGGEAGGVSALYDRYKDIGGESTSPPPAKVPNLTQPSLKRILQQETPKLSANQNDSPTTARNHGHTENGSATNNNKSHVAFLTTGGGGTGTLLSSARDRRTSLGEEISEDRARDEEMMRLGRERGLGERRLSGSRRGSIVKSQTMPELGEVGGSSSSGSRRGSLALAGRNRSRVNSLTLNGIVKSEMFKLLQSKQPTQKWATYLSKPAMEPIREKKKLLNKAQDRFRHSIRIVLLLLKWISSLSEHEQEDGEEGGGGGGSKTFTDIASDAMDTRLGNSGLTFNKDDFKAKKVINISSEVRHILSIPSASRTAEQIQTARYGLQHLSSFAEYPLHMQEKLCKVAWFQQVPSKRVIIRQGHKAENFYFVLSGNVVVNVLCKDPVTGEDKTSMAGVLSKGKSFGELALLHNSERTATVVSKDTVQLLTIGRPDFIDIYMSGKPGELPDHVKFISQLDFMKHWPVQLLKNHPKEVLFYYFKRGNVIVKDSRLSDWIYVIKSGSCQVMKQLRGVRPEIKDRRCKSVAGTNLMKLPSLGVGNIGSKVDTWRSQKTTPASTATEEPSWAWKRELTENGSFIKTKIKILRSIEPIREVKEKENQDASGKDVPTVVASITPGFSRSKFMFKTHFSPNPSASNKKHHSHKHSRKSQTPCPHKQRSKTPFDTDPYFDEECLVLRDPVFVQVQVLKPKDVFGLGNVAFENEAVASTTSVSLVSNGAECVMLHKNLFIKHANELVKRSVRQTVRPYPPETTLQDNLQNKVDWDVYKKRVLKSTMNYLHYGIH